MKPLVSPSLPGAHPFFGLLAALMLGCHALCPLPAAAAADEKNRELPELPEPAETQDLPEAAREQMETAVRTARKAPEDAEAVGRLGQVLHANGLPQKAFRAYARAALLDPRDWRWHHYTALALMDSGKAEKSIGSLERTVALRPGFAPAWYWLGIARMKANQPDAARAALQEAAHTSAFYELDQMARPGPRGKNPSLEFYADLALASLANDAGQPREALARLGRWLEKSGHWADLHEEIARAYRLLGKEESAEKAGRFALDQPRLMQPTDPLRDQIFRLSRNPAKLLEGIYLAVKAKNPEWALFLARQARQHAPDHPETALQLGLLLIEAQRESEGLPLLKEFRDHPKSEPALLDKAGIVLLRHGFVDEGESFFRRSIQRDADRAPVYFHLASLLAGKGQWETALAQADTGMALDPENLNMRYDYAQLLAEGDQPQRAIDQLKMILERTDHAARVHCRLGDIYFSLGEYREAAEAYSRALEQEPELEEASRGLRLAFERMPDQTTPAAASKPLTSLN